MKVEMKVLQEQDLSMVMDWRMRPYITEYMNTDPILTMEKQQQWFKEIENNPATRYWIIYYEDRPVGVINLVDIDLTNKKSSWGYYIAEKGSRSLQLALFLEWNLYDYAFDVLGLNKLYCETLLENEQVAKMHKMCGGTEEGILRQHIYKNGVYHDVHIISILSSEWMKKRDSINYEKFVFE